MLLRRVLYRFSLWILSAALFAGAQRNPKVVARVTQAEQREAPSWTVPHAGNPILPGYFADPTVVQTGNETLIFATEDPWGSGELGCWRSPDFVRWQMCRLNWPTKAAAVSPTANKNGVWAPSVVHARDGRWYMYVSIGSEVWVGVADQPQGPWREALGGRPLIPSTFNRSYNMIDAEAFIDSDGTPYLYWGSGLHWVNGHCFAVRLRPNMVSFDGEPRDVTPPNYFEGPFMYKRARRYYLMYSHGKATDGTYEVRYAVGSTPFGPFMEGRNSPILVSNPELGVLGPGHHAVFERGGRTYILYHRHSLPFDAKVVRRQVCVDELRFDAEGNIEAVVPTNAGPALVSTRSRVAGALRVSMSASSEVDAMHHASAAGDDNYATRWAPADDDARPWLAARFDRVRVPGRVEVRFEYPERTYRFRMQSSADGVTWNNVPDQPVSGVGSPVVFKRLPACRWLRLLFADGQQSSVLEWTAY